MQLIDKLIAMKNLQNKFTGIGLTYDDVLLVPAYSEILPKIGRASCRERV